MSDPTFHVVTNFDERYDAVGRLTEPTKAAYARYHGYGFARHSYAGSYGKVAALLAD